MPKKVLFINQETAPYMPDSLMACMGKALPERTQEAGYDIRTFMPKWGSINERRGQLHEVIRLSGINLTVNDSDHPLLIKVASLPTSRAQVYFIDNEEFFGRRKEILHDGQPLPDSGERMIFFAKGVLETVKKLRWAPDVMVCQGWMSTLIPLYTKVVYSDEPCLAETKVITTVHPDGFTGTLEGVFKQCIEYKEVTSATLAAYSDTFDLAELWRLALDFSDGVVLTPGVDAAITSYAASRELPTIACDEENYVQQCMAFIEKIIADQ